MNPETEFWKAMKYLGDLSDETLTLVAQHLEASVVPLADLIRTTGAVADDAIELRKRMEEFPC